MRRSSEPSGLKRALRQPDGTNEIGASSGSFLLSAASSSLARLMARPRRSPLRDSAEALSLPFPNFLNYSSKSARTAAKIAASNILSFQYRPACTRLRLHCCPPQSIQFRYLPVCQAVCAVRRRQTIIWHPRSPRCCCTTCARTLTLVLAPTVQHDSTP